MGRRIILGLAVLCFISSLALAEVPKLINLQGVLTDLSGQAISEDVSITFRIYKQAAGGEKLWEETHEKVDVNAGVYSVILGEPEQGKAKPIDLPFDKDYWLGIKVEEDEEMTPRRRLTSAPYAFRAKIADNIADGVITESKIADRAVTADKLAPVDWTKLKGVPAGFADGIDNTGGITDDSVLTQHIVDGTILNEDISNNAGISQTKIDNTLRAIDADKVDGKDASEFASSIHNHDDRYYTEIELNTSDGTPPNEGSNRVSWNNLADVPTGFADGIDEVGTAGGGVFRINVGTGITVTNPTGPTATVVANIGAGSDQVAAGDHNHDAVCVNEEQANSVASAMITNGEIVNEDISSAAAIDPNKISGTAWTSTNDGSGSGLDADLLDGKQASDFLSTANDWGRSGVATDLYEGTAKLTDKYVNKADLDHLDAADGSPANAVYVDNAGNVGIGTTNPTQKLHVIGGNVWVDDNKGKYIALSTTGSDVDIWAGGSANPNLYINNRTFLQAANTLINIGGGNVGIGTTTPDGKLDVEGGGIYVSEITSPSTPAADKGVLYEKNDGKIYFKNDQGTEYDLTVAGDGHSLDAADGSPTDAVYVDNRGNVGIGTTTLPSTNPKLYVLGSVEADAFRAFETSGVYAFLEGTPNDGWADIGGYNIATTDFAPTHLDGDPLVLQTRSNGNVGIGTTNPIHKLQVETTDDSDRAGHFEIKNATNSSPALSARTNGLGNAVYGYTSGTGKAGYFDGDVYINGTLTKSGGSFKIDHPLDPENKYLNHSFVESPDMMNIYNGNVAIDENGEAWVKLPEWLEALNRDFRYQLTAIRVPGPNLYIAEEISNNCFKIAGGKPGMKVSWQVTGIRQDPYANTHRILVEEQKPAKERGYYLHPELYGQPEEKGIEGANNLDLRQ